MTNYSYEGSSTEEQESTTSHADLVQCSTQEAQSPLGQCKDSMASSAAASKKRRVIEGPIIKEMQKVLPGALHQARKLLHIFAKAIGLSEFTRYPREHHICLQVHLLALDLSRAIKHQTITYVQVREGFENLWYLMEFCKRTSQRDAAVTARLTRKAILIMERVTSVMEDYSGVNSTDWVKVADMFLSEAKAYTQDAVPYKPAKFKYFLVNRMIGSGGFGTIYKAYVGGIVCTLKLIPCELLTDPKHACMDKLVASMIDNPFLVKYFACFSTKQAFVTAMEYIRGCDLLKVLRIARTIPEDVLRIIIAQLGEALQHMHCKGFIHRDVKPANLIIMVGCRIKLIDFDTAKTCIGKFVRKNQLLFSARTSAEFYDSQIAGTVPYLAPECITYMGYGRSMDWWATGVSTFHLATGRLPFQRFRTQEELQRMIAAGFYRWPKDRVFSLQLQEFVNALMQKKPFERLCSHRYTDFQEHPFFAGINWHTLAETDFLK
ncbi:microtubule-associated serine/threonine-protein kinase 3-like, partial [Tropilaelaps mercedesae]